MYQIVPFIQIECVAKVVNNPFYTICLLEECHFMKFIQHEDFICRVLEEIYVYDTEYEMLHSGVTIVERAEFDL